jgi:teichuronic acid biosynthesis glycosyltransferase TuaG
MSHSYSVVIPAYNASNTVARSLASVEAQSLSPVEVIVVDDASRDDTATVVESLVLRMKKAGIALRCIRLTTNSGPSAARNIGLRHASGDFVAFLDADDVWELEKLAIVEQALGTSDAALVCHGYSEPGRSAEDFKIDVRIRTLSLRQLLWSNPAQTSCATMRRQVGLAFDESMRYCEDHDLWLRIAEHSPVLRIAGRPLTLLGRPQLTPGGLSGSTLRMRSGELRVYYKFCSRQWVTRWWLLPLLAIYSLLKHLHSALRRLIT